MADLNKKQPPEVFYKKCLRPTTLLTTDSDKSVSCEFCEIFKNIFFKEHLWATASVESKLQIFIKSLRSWGLQLY